MWWCRSTPAASLSVKGLLVLDHVPRSSAPRRERFHIPKSVLPLLGAEWPLAASPPLDVASGLSRPLGGRIPDADVVLGGVAPAHNRTELRHSVGGTPRSTTGHRCRRDHRERTRPSRCQARPSSRIARSAAVPPLLPPGIYADAGEKFKGRRQSSPTSPRNTFRRWRRARLTPCGCRVPQPSCHGV